MIRRVLLIGLLSLLLALVGALGWLGWTESGLQWVYRQAPRLIPGELQAAEISGRLSGPLSLAGVRYRDDDQSVELRRATLEWDPWALFGGKLEIGLIRLEGLQVRVIQAAEPPKESPAPLEIPHLGLPVAIELQHIEVDDIRIVRGDETTLIERLRSRLSLDHQQLQVENLDIESGQLQFSLSGMLEPRPDLPHEIALSWRFRLDSGETLRGEGKLSGNLARTHLNQTLSGALQLGLDLSLDNPLQQPRWQAEVDITEFDAQRVDPTLPAIAGTLRLTAGGDLGSATASGRLGLDKSPYGPLATDFNLQRVALTEAAEGISFEQLRLALKRGEIETSGNFSWRPEIRWQAKVSTRGLDPGLIQAEWPGRIDAEFDLAGSIPAAGLEMALDIQRFDGELRGYPVSLHGRLDWQNDAAIIDGLEVTSGDTRLMVAGKLAQQLELQWSLASSDLAELYPAATGKLDARGRVYGTRDEPSIEAHLNGGDIGIAGFEAQSIDADLDLALNLQQTDQLPAQMLNLELQGRQVRWGEILLSEIRLTANDRGLQTVIAAPEGSAELELVGTLQADGWRGKLTAARLQNPDYGSWRLAAPAALEIQPEHYTIESLCLQNAQDGNVCAALRHRGPGGEIDLDLTAMPLGLLRPWIPAELEIESRADAMARLQYSLPRQLRGQVDIELRPGHINYSLAPEQQQRIEFQGAMMHATLADSGIDARLDFRLGGGDGISGTATLPAANLLEFDPATQSLQADLQLRLQQLGLIDAGLGQVENLQGSLQAKFEIEGKVLKPRLSGNARLEDASLYLPLAKLELTALNVDAHSATFDQIEYRAQARIAGGSFTVDGNTRLDADAGWPSELKASGEKFQLGTLLQPYLPEGLVAEGLVSADARLALPASGQILATVEMRSPGGLLTYPVADDETGQWTYRDIRLDLQIDERGVIADGKLEIGANYLTASLRLPDARPLDLDPKTQAVEGRLDVSSQDFSLVETLVPDLQNPNGQLQLSVDLAGTLAHPQLRGHAELEMTSLSIPRLGLALEQVRLQAATDQAGLLSLSGRANSGDGFVRLQGSGQLDPERGWPIMLHMTGEDFVAVRIPEATVHVSPDLQISLAHKTADVQGEISIPYARLRPRDVTSAARVSSDAVIVGQEQAPAREWQFSSNVRLLLGERVSLFGYGFDGLLGGNLVIEETPGQPTRGTGEITIVEGRYRAYGQHLDVEQGRLLFTGGPLTNPGLDVRAVRKTRDVTAGIKLSGRLLQPRLDLFSTPAMGQTDILSYLLTGGPLESANSGEGAMMANAALALGLSGGDQIARSIGDRFGFDEMRVESDSTGDQASLVVGRYLSPRLYVGYGVGLIESINTLNLRYQISDRWQLEAESGTDQGADLFYRFER